MSSKYKFILDCICIHDYDTFLFTKCLRYYHGDKLLWS